MKSLAGRATPEPFMRIRTIPQVYRNVNRWREILAVLTKYGLAGWLSRLRLSAPVRGLFKPQTAPLPENATRETRIRLALEELGPTFIKLGQIMSTRPDLVGAELAEELEKLQTAVPADPFAAVAELLEEELGRPLQDVFLEFCETPVASASIGQVHRAITHDGRAVAVKVQYPGVAAAIMADLDNAGLLFGAMGMLFPGLDPEPLVAELRERLAEELDYQLEAANQRLFADHYRGHPFIHVPDVVDELSAARVLTTELAEGERFEVLETWDQAERDLAAETIFRFVFGSLYRLHAFNGDPHPGNYLFRPGGQVTFLDFGLVKRFVPEEIAVLESMIQAMVLDHDIPRYRRIVEDIGMLQAGASFTDQQVEDYFGHFYDFVLADEVRTITPEYASETVRRFFDTTGPFGPIMKAANVPPAFVIIQRINLGLYAIFGQLRATANWRRISEELWPIVDGPPSTELGRQAAAWAAANGR
jgi:predicted unusual protein kinase regulating ubiquinone biosynthesis (AarF/ABC1/UbiB family)